MYTLLGSQAIDHLFRVSTGLDSMLIGEAEILAQVKDAFIQGQRAQSLRQDAALALSRSSSNAATQAARTQTDIGGQSVSIATAAVNFAIAHVGDLRGTSVVVVGAGKMGTLVARRLKAEGCREIVTLGRKDMHGVVDAIAKADVVVTSTGAPNFVLTTSIVGDAMRERPQRPLFSSSTSRSRATATPT